MRTALQQLQVPANAHRGFITSDAQARLVSVHSKVQYPEESVFLKGGK